MYTAVSSPARNSRASLRASRLSVLTRSPERFGVIAAILSERKERSKLALSKYAAEASEAAGKHPDKLSIAGKVKDIAGVHKALWPEASGEPLIEGSILVGLAVVTENQEEIRAARGKEISEELLSPVIDIEPNEEVSDAQSSVRQLPDDSPECNQSESSPAFAASAEAREPAGETSRRAYRERCANWRRNAR